MWWNFIPILGTPVLIKFPALFSLRSSAVHPLRRIIPRVGRSAFSTMFAAKFTASTCSLTPPARTAILNVRSLSSCAFISITTRQRPWTPLSSKPCCRISPRTSATPAQFIRLGSARALQWTLPVRRWLRSSGPSRQRLCSQAAARNPTISRSLASLLRRRSLASMSSPPRSSITRSSTRPGARKAWRRSHLHSRRSRRHRRSRGYSPRATAGDDSHQRDAREQRTRHHSAYRGDRPHRCRCRRVLSLRRGADRPERCRST